MTEPAPERRAVPDDDAGAVPTIGREALLAKIERGDAFHLFEVLGPMYFRKHHLPGARNLPPHEVRELVPRLVPDRDAEIVVYCWDDD